MAFNPNLKYNDKLSTEENLKATINWMNFLLREMTVGRVPNNKADLQHEAERIEESANIVEAQVTYTAMMTDTLLEV